MATKRRTCVCASHSRMELFRPCFEVCAQEILIKKRKSLFQLCVPVFFCILFLLVRACVIIRIGLHNGNKLSLSFSHFSIAYSVWCYSLISFLRCQRARVCVLSSKIKKYRHINASTTCPPTTGRYFVARTAREVLSNPTWGSSRSAWFEGLLRKYRFGNVKLLLVNEIVPSIVGPYVEWDFHPFHTPQLSGSSSKCGIHRVTTNLCPSDILQNESFVPKCNALDVVLPTMKVWKSLKSS